MSVTVQTIPQETSAATLNNVNEFYVPNILTFSLKKKTEDHLQTIETDSPRSRQNGDPFLKPVEQTIESTKDNPVLKALLRGKNTQGLTQWSSTRTSINNCHPFKKTEFSHDLHSDDTPVQVPKSLTKKSSDSSNSQKPARRCRSRSRSPDLRMTVLKEIRMNSNLSVTSASGISFCKSNATNERSLSLEKGSFEKDKELIELSIYSKRKKVASQSTISSNKPRYQYINSDRLIQLRSIVDNAIKNHKIYSMTGCYNSVRNALKQRGWIEKIDNDVKGRRKVNRYEEIALCQGEAEIMNKMLRNVTEDLCWLSRPYPYYCWKDFDKFEMVNRLPRAYFSNKIGLCNTLQQIQWFYESGVCTTKFPRTYNMSAKDEVEAFKDDFRLTACIGLLKWFLNAYKTGGEKAVRSPEGKVEMSVIEFSLRRCAEYVKTKQHEDIDILETPHVWDYQWDQFITQYYRVINDGQILKDDKEGVPIKAIVSNVQSMLNILKVYWPQFDIEGHQNFWIVKPGGRCCGAGIVIRNNLEQILIMVNPNTIRETRFIVQKYIERPLLIYNTKFDIRQWFLVTNVYPLTIWMYKESYLRFCSQPFTLKSTHESIHLCNNAVQRKYKNGKRDRGLPDENMWDCYTFQTYLKAIGHADAWEKYIYPGMKEGFIGALLASQESMERKKNCFELYGADFMISDTVTDGPWLIEINSNPAMDSSTSVTARLCPQVLEDVIKVVIDRKENKSASTGSFEMVFRQNCPPIPSYLGISLCVKGKKAYRSSGDCRAMSKKSKIKKHCDSVHYTDTEEESIVEEIISVTDSVKVPETPEKEMTPTAGENSGKIVNPETAHKRRRVDWVRKNIEDLKGVQLQKQSKSPSLANTSHKSSPRREVSEESFSEKFFKLLETVERSQFLKELKKLKKEKEEAAKKYPTELNNLIVEGLKSVEKKAKGLEENLAECEISKTLDKLVKLFHRRADEGSEPFGKHVKASETSGLANAKSCPNFDAAFERELETLDEKTGSGGSCESFFSTSSSRFSQKSSLEYFKDWKTTLSETRKTCEDVLAELQLFKETNSKVKFQEAVTKRTKDEVDFLKRIKQRRKCKQRTNIKKEGKDLYEGKDKIKTEDCRSASKFWGAGDDNLSPPPLAINSENGAVRNINYSLPKIKQRSRPLLPNASSEHGRKINATLQQTCCH